jgi:hypothetical protein
VDAASRAIQMQQAGSDSALELAGLQEDIFSVARASLVAQSFPEINREQYSLILADFENLFGDGPGKVAQIIDGVVSNSTRVLSLALAQKVAQKAEGSEAFTTEEDAGLRILLTEAPLDFGYWGPFKKVLKTVAPERYPAEFAEAAVRLSESKFFGRSGGDESPYEDLWLLRNLGSVGSSKTREYLRRRLLREYRNLAHRDPGKFVFLATKYLLARDSWSPKADVIEAFIFNGAGEFRDRQSRRAVAASANWVFNPPAVLGWSAHPNYLMELWTSVTERGEIQSFAFQGLRSHDAILSDLTGGQLALAVRSAYEPLVAYAVDQIIYRPETWTDLPPQGWATVCRLVNTETICLLLKNPSFPLYAIRQVLELGRADLSPALVTVFISRFPEWDEAEVSLDVPLWTHFLVNANSSQLWLLFEHVFSGSEPGGESDPDHLENAATALAQVVDESWEKLPSIATLAYLQIRISVTWAFMDHSAYSVSLAIFVLSLHRNYVGSGWASAWGDWVSLQGLAGAMVLLSQESKSREDALPHDFRGAAAGALEELVQLAGRRIGTSRDRSQSMVEMWSEFVAEPGIGGGLNMLRLLPTPQHFGIALQVIQADPRWEAWEAATLLTLILKESDGSPLLDLRVATLEKEDMWRAVDFDALLNHTAEIRRSIWKMLGALEPDIWLQSVVGSSNAASTLCQELHSYDFNTSNDAQSLVLVSYMSQKGTLSELPRDSALAAATSQNADVASLGVRALRSQMALTDVWLQLVESELPTPLEEGFAALETIKDRAALTNALLLAVDSAVAVVRRRGLELIDTLGERLDREQLFLAMSESSDPQVRNRVAEEALVAGWATAPAMGAFDDQVLIVRRRARKAKEFVKRRLEVEVPEGYTPSPERIAVLLDLAHHGKPRDAEWAHVRLAHLGLAGVIVDEVTVSRVSEGPHSG